MNHNPPRTTRFTPDISCRLRSIATPEEIAIMRSVLNEAERGHRPWYLALLVAIIEHVKASRRSAESDRRD